MHDMNELLGKLRAHMYKLDKRSAAGEAGTQVGGGGGNWEGGADVDVQ